MSGLFGTLAYILIPGVAIMFLVCLVTDPKHTDAKPMLAIIAGCGAISLFMYADASWKDIRFLIDLACLFTAMLMPFHEPWQKLVKGGCILWVFFVWYQIVSHTGPYL